MILPATDVCRPEGNLGFFLCPGSGPHTHHASIGILDKPDKLHKSRRYRLALVGYTASSVPIKCNHWRVTIMYQVKQRSPLGDTYIHGEFNSFSNAMHCALALNANRSRSMKAYPVFIYETITQRVIKPTRRPAYFYAIFTHDYYYSGSNPEVFTSVKAIKSELQERLNNQRRYPCVDTRASFEVYYLNPENLDYTCPDFRVHFGKRGGIKITKYV